MFRNKARNSVPGLDVSGIKPGIEFRLDVSGIKPGIEFRLDVSGIKPGIESRLYVPGIKPGIEFPDPVFELCDAKTRIESSSLELQI